MNQPYTRLSLTLAAAVFLGGCASNSSRTDAAGETTSTAPISSAATPAMALAERAETRWKMLIEGKPELAYDYLSPGYRETRDRNEYAEIMRSRPVKWTGVQYQDQECEGEVCKVRLMITYSLEMPVAMVGKVDSVDFQLETWLWIDDNWYYLPATDAQKGLR